MKTPLHHGCETGDAFVVKLLIENGADPEARDNCGRTAVHYAVSAGKSEVLPILAEGRDEKKLMRMKDHGGRTPLHHAVFLESNQIQMVQKIITLGGEVNALDMDRRTPLHYAAEAGKSRIIPILLQRGAITNLRDTQTDMTPIELAKNDQVREIIIAYC